MRSRSMRTWAPSNAGALGSILTVCACAHDPIHVTAQGKSIRVHCACGWSELLFKDQTWCVYVPYSIPYLGGHGNKMLTFLMLIFSVTNPAL